MKNFEEIIAKIARENGTTPENVLREMQLAIDHAYDHHDKEAQKLWDMMLLAPGAHSQFGSGKNTQFEPEQRANPFENVFSKTAVFPPPAIAETDL